MARKELLHSGEFITRDEYKYKIEFYKIYDIHAFPESIAFDVYGGTGQVTIWSTKGSAYLQDTAPLWISYSQIKAEQIPGTRWYKYTYLITCDENGTGSDRSYEWPVRIEDGEGVAVASCTFTVTQSTSGSTGDMTVSPTVLYFDYRSGTQQVAVNRIGYGLIQHTVTYDNPGDDWVTVRQTDWGQVYRYDISVTTSYEGSRTAVVTFSGDYGSASVTVIQGETEFIWEVSPTSFDYAGEGSTNGFTFNNAPLNISYTIPTGIDWVTVSNLSSSGVDITTSLNDTIYSRSTTVRFYNTNDNTEYVDVEVYQDAAVSSLSVVPSIIVYAPAGGTYGVTATWEGGSEPTATITYSTGAGGWMTSAGSYVEGNTKEWAWTASPNNTGSSRTALITVTNGLQTEQVSVVQATIV